MAVAVVPREDNAFANGNPPPARNAILARYRQLREISKRHHHDILKLISGNAMLQQARRLGLAQGRTLILDDMEEMNYVFDLAIHTAPPGRSRVIDRYARSAPLSPGSVEALMLEAMRAARFAILILGRRHDAAGVIATDLFRRTDVWLVDIGLEASLEEGAMMATRLYTPERFSMTAGVNVPFDLALIEDLYDALPRRLEDINTGIPKSDDVRHAVPVHVRHLARVGVVAAPATGIHAKCGKLKARLREIPVAGRQSHPHAVLAESDDVRHAVPVHVRHLARVGVIAAPAAGPRAEGRYARGRRSEVRGCNSQCGRLTGQHDRKEIASMEPVEQRQRNPAGARSVTVRVHFDCRRCIRRVLDRAHERRRRLACARDQVEVELILPRREGHWRAQRKRSTSGERPKIRSELSAWEGLGPRSRTLGHDVALGPRQDPNANRCRPRTGR
jgi:hypothetical protein